MGRSPNGRKQLEDAKASAFAAISAGNGAQIVSGSGNGMAFTTSTAAGALTQEKWFSLLDLALAHLDAGTVPTSSAQMRF